MAGVSSACVAVLQRQALNRDTVQLFSLLYDSKHLGYAAKIGDSDSEKEFADI